MANFFKKAWSGLDFWDKAENQQQRDSYAQEDEEEKKRRQREQAARSSTSQSDSASDQDTGDLEVTDSPSQNKNLTVNKVASQGAFSNPTASSYVAPEKMSEENARANKGREEIDRMTQENLDQAMKEGKQQTSWFDRTFSNRDWDEQAKIKARSRATTAYQEKYGYNKQPEVMEAINKNREMGDKISENLAEYGRGLDTVDRASKKVGAVASYVPVTGSVMNLGLAGAEKLAKYTGNENYAQDIEDTRLQLDVGMTKEQFDALDPETKQKLRNLQGLGLALSPLDFLGAAGLAKSGVVGAGRKATTQLIKEGTVDAATKQALKSSVKSVATQAVAPAIVGAGASVGAQAYLGGTDDIDLKEAAKTGLLTGAASLLFPSQGVRAAGDEAVENAVKNSVKNADAPEIPGAVKTADAAAEGAIEISEGTKSTNLAKADSGTDTTPGATPSIEVTNPARSGDEGNPANTPIVVNRPNDGNQSVDGPNAPVDPQNPGRSITNQDTAPEETRQIEVSQEDAPPVQNRNTTTEPTQSEIDQAAQLGTPLPGTEQLDADGNPVRISDAEYQRQLAEEGVAPQRGESYVGSEEEARAKLREQAIADEVDLADGLDLEDLDTPAYLRKPGKDFQKAEAEQARLDRENQADVEFADEFDAPAYQRQGKTLSDETPEAMDAKLRNNAAEAAKEPSLAGPISKSFRLTGITEPLNLVMHALANTNNVKLIRKMVQAVVPEASGQVLNRAVKQIVDADNPIRVGELLTEAQTSSRDYVPELGMLSDAPANTLTKADETPEVPVAQPAKMDTPPAKVTNEDDGAIMADFTDSEDGTQRPAQQLYDPEDVKTPEQIKAEAERQQRNDAINGTGNFATPTRNPAGEPPAPPSRQAPTGEGFEGTTAPRQRAILDGGDDPVLDGMLKSGATKKERVNLENAKEDGMNQTRALDDAELTDTYNSNFRMDSPSSGYAALSARDRLKNIDTPEARQAVVNITNAIADKSSESGLWLRFSQVLFDDMAPAEKVDSLMAKLNKAGASMGEETDKVRAELLRLVEVADESGAALQKIDDLIAQTKAKILSGEIRGEDGTRVVDDLMSQRKTVSDELEFGNGDVMDYFDKHIPKGALGARAGRAGRLAMLMSPFGRVFDMISTSFSATAKGFDTVNAAMLGKAGNKLSGNPAKFEDTLPSISAPLKNAPTALSKVADDWSGKRRVNSISEELERKTRSDIKQVTGPVSRRVKAVVEAPTEATKFVESEALRSKGMQMAKQNGLEGADAENFAKLYSVSATVADQHAARQDWFKVNSIHDNVISNKLNLLAKNLDEVAGGWGSIVRNLVIPFTSFFGGQAHLALTDRNVLYNAYSAGKNFRQGHPEDALKDLGRLGTNGTTAIAASMILAQQGILTDKDANGDSYDGVYIHIGNRYLPVAIAGQFAPALILGYSMNQGFDAENPVEGVLDVLGNTVAGVAKSTDIAATFGGENSLMSKLREVNDLQAGADDVGAKTAAIIAGTAGEAGRQYIPSFTGDINSGLDMVNSLNPTHEKADVNAYDIDPNTGEPTDKKNFKQTEINKWKNKVPGWSQTLDRKEGVTAKDPLDRITKGTRETGEAATQRKADESVADLKKRLDKEGVPTKDEDINARIDSGEYDKALQGLEYQLKTAQYNKDNPQSKVKEIQDKIEKVILQKEDISVETEGIDARVERGEYDKAIKGLEYQVSKMDKDTPESDRKTKETDIKRLQVTKDGNFKPEVIALYKDISNSEWRAMGDKDDPDYNGELFALLQAYDEAMATNGVSRYDTDPKKGKYFTKSSGRGGGGGSKGPKLSADIATQDFSGKGFTPQQLQKATFGVPGSAAPQLEKVPINDRSKLKKISVTKGGR